MRCAKLRPVTDLERMRVSDADREQALVQLREHAAAGRLGLDELEGRSELVLGARTRAELAQAVADLPDLASWRYRIAHLSLGAHAAAFVVVNAALLVVWEATRAQPRTPADEGVGYWWPFWILLVWAAGLAAHAVRSRRRRPRALTR
jgi:DUF1707 SHOCT-like domain/2TM domain